MDKGGFPEPLLQAPILPPGCLRPGAGRCQALEPEKFNISKMFRKKTLEISMQEMGQESSIS
jgi:hypothetical protein